MTNAPTYVHRASHIASGPGIASDPHLGALRLRQVAAERARIRVTRAIRSALSRIAEQRERTEYLDATIWTGTFCSYVPRHTRRSRAAYRVRREQNRRLSKSPDR